MIRLTAGGLRSVRIPLLVLALSVAGCGGGEADTTGDHVVVEMFDNRFSATEIQIPVGGSVTFVGAGLAPHNAVAADGSWSTESAFDSLEQFEGDASTLVFDQLGVIPAGMGSEPAWHSDVLTMSQAERAILEFNLPEPGRYMFHPHQHHLAMRGSMGWFAAI